MASKLVVDAVLARLTANWTRCSIVEPNESSSPPADGGPFLTVQFPLANEDQISLGQVGARTFRESGGFRLVLSIPRSSGVSTWLGWIDELRALFRAQQLGGVSCFEASPAYLDDGNEDGNYFTLSSAVEYYADILA